MPWRGRGSPDAAVGDRCNFFAKPKNSSKYSSLASSTSTKGGVPGADLASRNLSATVPPPTPLLLEPNPNVPTTENDRTRAFVPAEDVADAPPTRPGTRALDLVAVESPTNTGDVPGGQDFWSIFTVEEDCSS